MKRENLGEAITINNEIKRLEQEIYFLENSTKSIGHSIVKALRPKRYNYKGLFCSARDLDSVDSVVYLTYDECIVLANCKREKIEKLKLQYELLDGDIGE